MNKPRKHKWITEAVNANEKILSVWASDEELKNESTQKKFLGVIEKISNDPRITNVEKRHHPTYGDVFVFYIDG